MVFTRSKEAAFGNLGNTQDRHGSSAQAVPHGPAQQQPPSPTRF